MIKNLIDPTFFVIDPTVEGKSSALRHVASAENYADIITNPLVHAKFETCRDLCSGMKSDLKRTPIVQSEDEETVSQVYMFFDEHIHDMYVLHA